MDFLILLAAAPISLGIALACALWLWRTARPWSDPRKWLPAISLAVYGIAGVVVSADILDDPSSTAAIALYYVPTLALIASLLTLLLLGSGTALIRGGLFLKSRRGELLAAGLILLSLGVLAARIGGQVVEYRRTIDPTASAESLRQQYREAQDTQDAWVLTALAKNPATPADLLASLAGDSGPAVSRAPSLLGPFQWGQSAQWNLAQRDDLPPEALRQLAQTDDELVVAGVAGNPRTPAEVLRRLGEHRSVVVLRALAYNVGTPPDVLDRLAKHSDPWIQRGVERTRSREHDEKE